MRIDTERTTCYRKARKNNDGDDDDEDGDDLHPGVDIGSQTSAPEKEAQSGSHQSRRECQTKGYNLEKLRQSVSTMNIMIILNILTCRPCQQC